MAESTNDSNRDIVVMNGISKSFPGVLALETVDFTLRKGEIHALVGETVPVNPP